MKAAKPSWLPALGRLERLLLCLCNARLGLGSPVGAAYLLGVDAPHPCHVKHALLSLTRKLESTVAHAPCVRCCRSYRARLGRAMGRAMGGQAGAPSRCGQSTMAKNEAFYRGKMADAI